MNNNAVDIVAINRAARRALTDEGVEVEIVRFLDDDGDETNDPDLAVVAVVKAATDVWIAVVLANFETASVH